MISSMVFALTLQLIVAAHSKVTFEEFDKRLALNNCFMGLLSVVV